MRATQKLNENTYTWSIAVINSLTCPCIMILGVPANIRGPSPPPPPHNSKKAGQWMFQGRILKPFQGVKLNWNFQRRPERLGCSNQTSFHGNNKLVDYGGWCPKSKEAAKIHHHEGWWTSHPYDWKILEIRVSRSDSWWPCFCVCSGHSLPHGYSEHS